ncbi:LacI family DNA-binding transcriptional regulator, partial [Streptomyces chrestomyceticus]|uniref:LacI family DNA-binding transcriptional regulator n=1 Tax=Streptomyces chrestomyceticus TaxID=68185 RepID=UPI0035A93D04
MTTGPPAADDAPRIPTAPPRRRPTMKDIAERAGVSPSAVSFALNDRDGVSPATRARIRQVAEELGWQPNSAARALSGERSGCVGLVLARPARTLGVESFFLQLVSGIQEALAARRVALLFQVVEDLDAECATYRRWWAERRVDGVLVVDPRTEDPRPALLASLTLPTVVIGDTHPGPPTSPAPDSVSETSPEPAPIPGTSPDISQAPAPVHGSNSGSAPTPGTSPGPTPVPGANAGPALGPGANAGVSQDPAPVPGTDPGPAPIPGAGPDPAPIPGANPGPDPHLASGHLGLSLAPSPDRISVSAPSGLTPNSASDSKADRGPAPAGCGLAPGRNSVLPSPASAPVPAPAPDRTPAAAPSPGSAPGPNLTTPS